MKLIDKTTAVGYKCPNCGGTVSGPDGALSLSGDMFTLRCGCRDKSKEIPLRINKKNGVFAFSVPCFICGETHKYDVSSETDFGGTVVMNCPMTGLGICFAGSRDGVTAAAASTDARFREAVEDAGFETPENFFEARFSSEESRPGISPEDLTSLNYLIKTLTEEGTIQCLCGICADPLIDSEGDDAVLTCPVCGAKARIPLRVLSDPYRLAEIDGIDLVIE